MAVIAWRGVPVWRQVAVALPGLPIAAFFGFVGWNKAFAPMAELQMHHAWTVHVPWWIGRPMGWAEMAAAFGLAVGLAPRAWPVTRLAALALIANQIAAAWVHVRNGEAVALGQNLILVLALGLIAFAARAPEPTPERRMPDAA